MRAPRRRVDNHIFLLSLHFAMKENPAEDQFSIGINLLYFRSDTPVNYLLAAIGAAAAAADAAANESNDNSNPVRKV